MMQQSSKNTGKSNPTAMSAGAIVIGAIALLTIMAFLFRGKVNF